MQRSISHCPPFCSPTSYLLVGHFSGQYVSLLENGRKTRALHLLSINFYLNKLKGGLHVTNLTIRWICPAVHPSVCPSTFWHLDSNSKILCPVNLKLNRVIRHNQGLLAFEIGVPPFACFEQALIRIFLFPNYNLKTLCPINLKLNRVSGHHHRLVAFEIGVSLFSCCVMYCNL